MKYVIVKHSISGAEVVVLASEMLRHADLVKGLREGGYRPVAAGFANMKSGRITIPPHGSVSLNLRPRENDGDLIKRALKVGE